MRNSIFISLENGMIEITDLNDNVERFSKEETRKLGEHCIDIGLNKFGGMCSSSVDFPEEYGFASDFDCREHLDASMFVARQPKSS